MFATVRSVMGDPATAVRFGEVGARVVASTSPEAFAAELDEEMACWRDLAAALGAIRRLD